MYPYPTKDLVPNLAFAIMGELAKMTTEQVPELKPDLPSFTKSNFKIGVDDTVCIATIEFKESGIPTGGTMDAAEFAQLKTTIGTNRRFSELKVIDELAASFDWNKLVIAVDVQNDAIDWHLVAEDLASWANVIPLPRAQNINEKRMRMALPTPPQYSLASVQAAMWVLECDESSQQGTAFDLVGYGTVTNAHVVEGTSNLQAFRADKPTEKFAVSIDKQNQALDLAIITVEGSQSPSPLHGASTETKQMDHVAVCGFPNFRLGDSGVLSPGIIVGTRMKSGIRRLLTNAGIIAGMSGGPAIGADNQVIGVCVTGSDNFQATRETEDQSIIPIEALDLLE
ncbi:MAG: serine protease [Pseudomonadota bacterium]|nr:serine protease [Pseudomonadota bacterium]